jgi:DNA-directed RNA polymerase specialized sigma24 family protein
MDESCRYFRLQWIRRIEDAVPEDRHTLPDAELMRRAQAEDAEAFGVLVERYQQALLRVTRSRMRRVDWADELVQETLMAAYRGRRTFDRRFSFRTWLWTILLNHCKAHAARHHRHPRIELLTDASSLRTPPRPVSTRSLPQTRRLRPCGGRNARHFSMSCSRG